VPVTYLDGMEGPPYRTPPPNCCPLCKGRLTTMWSGVIKHRIRGYHETAVPAHVCKKCKIAVRVCMLPNRPLFTTRKAARASVAKKVAKENARFDAKYGARYK
jgi:hypothetical protein